MVRRAERPGRRAASRADLGAERYDLVLVLYLHLSRAVLPDLLRRCADAVAPGGHLLVLRHGGANIEHGVGGPPDPDVLYDVELLRAAATGLEIERAEQVRRPIADAFARDTLLPARRR